MKEIKLTQGKVAIVDDEYYDDISQFKWCAFKHRNTYYAVRNIIVGGRWKTLLMHRYILNMKTGICVDHVNGDGLFNVKENLRHCTNQENQRNRHSQKNNKLRIKGVRWCKIASKFKSQIGIGGKTIHLGYFNVMGDADSAYRIAEEKYFGEFARGLKNG